MAAIRMNQLCYCKAPLEIWSNPNEFVCNNCCKKITDADQVFYHHSCKYEEITAGEYIICTGCYDATDDIDNNNLDDQDVILFMKNKFIASLNKISLAH